MRDEGFRSSTFRRTSFRLKASSFRFVPHMDPASEITAYLFAHKSTLEFSTIDQVVKDVKLSVFYSMCLAARPGWRLRAVIGRCQIPTR